MTPADKASAFASLHTPGDPLVLFNVWDAGSAKAVSEAGAKAIATGSMSVAGAQGFPDGEVMPMHLVLQAAAQIASATPLPVSIDFEGGYAANPEALAQNVACLIDAGCVGLNFEDRIVQGQGLYPSPAQTTRINAIRAMADDKGFPLFINARTDLFLQNAPETHADVLDEAIARGQSYASAGASGFFVPGLKDPDMIARVCDQVPLPVNVLKRALDLSHTQLGAPGVARISYGPGPFFDAMEALSAAFKSLA